MNPRKIILPLITAVLFPYLITAQETKQEAKKKEAYEFEFVKELKTTPVKNQSKTGTCWSFATTSFIETELIRMGKGEHILSPIFNVRYTYPLKAEKFMRYNGTSNFGPGGQAHDVIDVIKEHGLVPDEVYSGMNINEEIHNHGELDAVIKAIVDAVNKVKGGKITPRWQDVVESTLNIYLGVPPKEFNYKGKTYNPKSFAESLGFNPDDYIEFTSYSHHPFYTKFNLEIPDNWSEGLYYNLPIDELIKIIDNALINGYSVAWDGDVSEKTFDNKKCIATVPEGGESAIDNKKKDADEEETPVKEKSVSQQMRQDTFDNRETTDDHLMHITGLAKDKTGAKFYYTKNSWGTKDRKYGGYWYMSEPYVRLKTLAVMLHKDALPKEIKEKLGITK